MMKIKLKETLLTELTKAPDVLIMKRGGVFDCENLLNESAPEGLPNLRKERNHESERGRRQHPQ